MVAALPDDVSGLRDKAILLIGFAGPFRRSEIVGLLVRDVPVFDNFAISKAVDMTYRGWPKRSTCLARRVG